MPSMSPVFFTGLPFEEEGWMAEKLFCLHKRGRRLLPVQLWHGGQGRQAHRAPQRGQEPCLQEWNRSRTFASEISQYTVNCKENPIYVFLFWEWRGLSPNFHIHVSVSDVYIPRIGPHNSL
jgi:hypothetical protein